MRQMWRNFLTLCGESAERETQFFYFSHSLSSLSLSFSFSMPCSVIKCVVYVSTVLNEKCHHPYRGGTSVSCMLWNVERKKYRKFPFSSSTSLMLSLSHRILLPLDDIFTILNCALWFFLHLLFFNFHSLYFYRDFFNFVRRCLTRKVWGVRDRQ